MNFFLQHSGTLTNTGKLASSVITLKSQHSGLEKSVQVFRVNKIKANEYRFVVSTDQIRGV